MAELFARFVEAERGRFFLLLPVAMGISILIYFALPVEPPLWVGLALLAGSAAALGSSWRHPYWRFAATLALCAAMGFARAEWRTAAQPPLRIIPSQPVRLSGTISRIEMLPGEARLTLSSPRLDGGPLLPRAIRIKLRASDPLPLYAGEGVSGYAILFGPTAPAWPGGWDMARDYYFRGLNATGFALTNLTLTQPAAHNQVEDILQNLRAAITRCILASLPLPTASIAVTLLTGDEQIIPPPERQNFIEAGLAHILAVAGLHAGIVMGIVFAATRFALTRAERVALHLPVKSISAVAALAGGAAYAALTGAHLPILRALAMAALATAAMFAGRRVLSLRGLALAAMLLMLLTPETILGTSFQMSFSAVAALISGFAAVQGVSARLHAGHSRLLGLALHVLGLAYTSLLAGGASMPFAAYQFQQLQPYWIPANLLAVPLTAFWIMPWGLAALALMPLHLGPLALIPMGWGIQIIIWVTASIATWPDALLRIQPVPGAAILLFAAGLAFLCIWRSALRLTGLPLMLLGLAVALAARPPDVLVSNDAKLIVIRNGASLLLLTQPKASHFTLEQWQNIWGGLPLTPVQCSAPSCRVGAVWYTTQPVCAQAALIVAPIEMPHCPAPVIDRLATYHAGAMAAWLTPHGVMLRTDAAAQGKRPWVTSYPQP